MTVSPLLPRAYGTRRAHSLAIGLIGPSWGSWFVAAFSVFWLFSTGTGRSQGWENIGLPGVSGNLHSVGWGAGRFVAVGDAGAIWSSSDGSVWTPAVSVTCGRH